MECVYLQWNCVCGPAVGVEVKRSIDVGSHMFTHRDIVLGKISLVWKNAENAHMGNEAVHQVVCPFTDCALP